MSRWGQFGGFLTIRHELYQSFLFTLVSSRSANLLWRQRQPARCYLLSSLAREPYVSFQSPSLQVHLIKSPGRILPLPCSFLDISNRKCLQQRVLLRGRARNGCGRWSRSSQARRLQKAIASTSLAAVVLSCPLRIRRGKVEQADLCSASCC